MTQMLPDAALDDRLGFVGTAGSGKSYAAMGRIERLLEKKARGCYIDPLGVFWGLRLQRDGKTESRFDVVIFGGPHGDLPLTEHSGALIGETVASMAESCIIDLSEIGTKAGERRFMLHFLTALYRKANGEPLHLVIDEADMFAPQKLLDRDGEAAKLLGMMETVVRRGRIKGFIPWLITQRPAVIAKDVLSQIDGLVAFKLTSSQDRDALSAWVEGSADKADWKTTRDALPAMEVGQAVVWIPGRNIMTTVRFPLKKTFDSSRTPKRGEKKKTAVLVPLDLGKLREKLSTIDAETKANDPKALKAEITRLTRELATKVAVVPGVDFDLGFKEGVTRGWTAGYPLGFKAGWAAGGNALGNAVEAEMDRFSLEPTVKIDIPPALETAPPQRKPAAMPAPASSPARPVRAPTSNGSLPKGERACLIAIAQHSNGVTRQQLTVLTGYKRSTRDAYLQRLREKEMLNEEGGRVLATDLGVVTLGSDYAPLPTGAALREHVLGTLPDGESTVLTAIIAAYPNSIERDAISTTTGYKRSTRDAYIQRLTARELVSADRGSVRASQDLF